MVTNTSGQMKTDPNLPTYSMYFLSHRLREIMASAGIGFSFYIRTDRDDGKGIRERCAPVLRLMPVEPGSA
jgi:hypothetical protein